MVVLIRHESRPAFLARDQGFSGRVESSDSSFDRREYLKNFPLKLWNKRIADDITYPMECSGQLTKHCKETFIHESCIREMAISP